MVIAAEQQANKPVHAAMLKPVQWTSPAISQIRRNERQQEIYCKQPTLLKYIELHCDTYVYSSYNPRLEYYYTIIILIT